jgi:hypothetical protein
MSINKPMILAMVVTLTFGLFQIQSSISAQAQSEDKQIHFGCTGLGTNCKRSTNLLSEANPKNSYCSQYMFGQNAVNKVYKVINKNSKYYNKKVRLIICQSYFTTANYVDSQGKDCNIWCQATFGNGSTAEVLPLLVKVNVCKNPFTKKNPKSGKSESNINREFDQITYDRCEPITSTYINFLDLKETSSTRSPIIPSPKTPKPKIPKIPKVSATLVKYRFGSRLTNNCYQLRGVRSSQELKNLHPSFDLQSTQSYSLLYTKGDLAEAGDRHVLENQNLIYVPTKNLYRIKSITECKARIIYTSSNPLPNS